MKGAAVALLLCATGASAFAWTPAARATALRSRARLSMSTVDKPVAKKEKKRELLDGINQMKKASDYLRTPLREDMGDSNIFVSKDSYNLLKFHGSYQQDDREKRPKGPKATGEKAYQFMLRLKVPAGEVPGELYHCLDDLCMKFGQKDLRITTRQAFQLHGVMKGDLGHVIRTIMEIGSTTIGGCGDINRNIMMTPAAVPINTPEYAAAREWCSILAELFVPQTNAFAELWTDGEKVSTVQYWKRHIQQGDADKVDAYIQDAMRKDTGKGIIVPDATEPLYGDMYLPRKFKIGVTVPGDNSIDIYTNDIGVVVVMDASGQHLEGFNVMVGGGMGRTHGKETTFARAADHLGFVPKEHMMEVSKAIVAAQRDFGNREIRANARMKYLVHELGIDRFRELVESYLEFKIDAWRPMKEWRYEDWMGWHDAQDGTLFVGINVEQGRVLDKPNGAQLKTFLAECVDEFGASFVLSPSQSILVTGIKPADKAAVQAKMAQHAIKEIEEVHPLTRLAIACPALPLCGLAVGEAERFMPTMLERIGRLLEAMDLGGEEVLCRMTGCPNGCARPYMAELAFVGDGKDSYQVYVGGSPVLTNVGFSYKERAKVKTIENTLEPLFAMWKAQRLGPDEAFGSFCYRVGLAALEGFAATYTPVHPCQNDVQMPAMVVRPMYNSDTGIEPSSGR